MKTLALLALLAASTAAIGDADLSYTVTARKTELVTGERVKVDVRVANAGPDAATDVAVLISTSMTASTLVDIDAPAGWQCIPVRYSSVATCTIASFPSGAEGTFTTTVITAGQPSAQSSVGGNIRGASHDPNMANNIARATIQQTAAPRHTDLQVTGETQQIAREGSEVRHTITVHNAGPDEARDVAAIVDLLVAFPGPALTLSGAGWTCQTVFGGHAVCTRPALAAGASAPIELRFQAPQDETSLAFTVVPVAELSHDPTLAFFAAQIIVGSRENWRMMLVPLTSSNVPGANNSLWLTRMNMVIRADAAPAIQPDACAFPFPGSCPPEQPPLRAAFDPRDYLFVWPGYPLGQFVYVRAEAFDKVQMNARIFDYSRERETAGAEIPVPRDTEFTDLNVLLNVPVAPEFRHTLRIYDNAGRNGARVAIRIFADDGRRVTVEQTLATPHGTWETGVLRLPVHPAAVQVELGQLMPLDGVESLYVEVEPLDEGVRIWSFVSITNNTTHHVTTVTPQ